MKKTIVALSIFGLLFVGGQQSVQAEETDRPALLAQLESLLKLVQQLQQQVSAMQTSQGQVVPTNMVFSDSIVMSAENDSVRLLQQILASDPAVYPEGKVTGYFGPLTESALKNFQRTWKLEETGTFNEQTRYILVTALSQTPITPASADYLQNSQVKAAIAKAATDYSLKSLVVNGKVVFSSNPVFSFLDVSKDTATLQRMLATDPKLYPTQNITGVYDSKTAYAVTLLQQRLGLKLSSFVDASTLAFLRQKLVENNSSTIKSGLLLEVKKAQSVIVEDEDVSDLDSLIIDVNSDGNVYLVAVMSDGLQTIVGSKEDFSGTDEVEYDSDLISVDELEEIIIEESSAGLPVNEDIIQLMRDLAADFYGVDEDELPSVEVEYESAQ